MLRGSPIGDFSYHLDAAPFPPRNFFLLLRHCTFPLLGAFTYYLDAALLETVRCSPIGSFYLLLRRCAVAPSGAFTYYLVTVLFPRWELLLIT